MWKVVRFIATFVAVAYLGVMAWLYVQQRRFVFANDPREVSPVEAGFPEASVARLTTADDERLVAWYVKPAPGKLLALYFHGNGGSLAHRAGVFRDIVADGTGLLAIDYRGFGGSTGSPTEEGLHLDADAAYAKARALGFAPGEIVLFGASLGSGVAVRLATRREVAGVVLDSPYSSVLDVAADRYWMFPVSLLLKDTFPSDAIIGDLRVPLLIMHGDADRTVPFRFGEKLFARANQPKDFLRVAGGGHIVVSRPEGLARLREFAGSLGAVAAR